MNQNDLDTLNKLGLITRAQLRRVYSVSYSHLSQVIKRQPDDAVVQVDQNTKLFLKDKILSRSEYYKLTCKSKTNKKWRKNEPNG